MRFGLTLPNVGKYGDARTLSDLAGVAEEAGWDGVFVWDTLHFQADESAVCDPWIALAAIAVRTERIKIGTMVAAPARRRPWKMAREATTLDHLSHGRLILGVGVGDGSDRGFADFGEETDVRKRARLLDESLDVLQGLWSGQPFSYSGEHTTSRRLPFYLHQSRCPGFRSGWVDCGREKALCPGPHASTESMHSPNVTMAHSVTSLLLRFINSNASWMSTARLPRHSTL